MNSAESQVESIFFAALDQPSAQRAAYLDSACGDDVSLRRRVEQLLNAQPRVGSFLHPGSPAGVATFVFDELPERPGTVIGPYKLLEQIGEGGFGIVYMAEQEKPVRRRVALKIIKPGMDTRQVLARFGAERQALALMDHPNIARALDAGATGSGRPYFVMELVRGIPITDYCDQNNLAVYERLDLFVQVCHAVQHAHQKGIIHRDIKPSNILVTVQDSRAVPKVIDFGVAKALNQRLTNETLFTRFTEMIGTPLYMSPEQAEMTSLDIDTRSDVYSLGVLLYELLTGSTPLQKDRLKQAAYDEIRRMIREEDPPMPSLRISTLGDTRTAVAAHRHVDPHRLSQLVRGDLDWIVMKALEKDRTHRYDTASNFAADVLRYLGDQPVEARPPSAAYRFGKFARRNRAAFTMAAVVAVALLLGIVGTTWQAIRATWERDRAESARQAESVQRQVAEAQKSEAETMRQIAESTRAEATRQLYVSQMNRAEQHWDDHLTRRTCELLESTKPEHTGGIDLRGWEWHYLWRQTHSARMTLNFSSGGPGESPLCLAFSPDGQLLVSGGSAGTLKMWDATGTRLVRTFKAHGDRIACLCFSRDGARFATNSKDGTVKLWETSTCRELRTFPGSRTAPRYGMALSPDGHQLAIASKSTEITIWETSSGKEIRTLKGHNGFVRVLAFSPDGKRLASGDKVNAAVRLWDVTTGRELWLFTGHKVGNHVTAIAFSPDGKTLVSASGRNAMHLDVALLKYCDVETGQETQTFTLPEPGEIASLAFNRDGTRLASANDRTMKLWDPASGLELQAFQGHADRLTAVAFSPQGDVIASASWAGTICFWDAASRQEPLSLRHPGTFMRAVYSGDGQRLAVAGGGVIAVRDASTGLRLWEQCDQSREDLSAHRTSNLRFDPTGRILASGLADGNVHLRDAQDGRVLQTIKAHDGQVTSLDFSPDGRVLATGGRDKQVAFWNPLDGRPLATLKGHTESITGVAFSPDGKLLASTGAEQAKSCMLRLWDVSSGREVWTLATEKVQTIGGHSNEAPGCVVFSRDGRQIFTGGAGIIRVWDVETGKPTRVDEAFRLPDPEMNNSSIVGLSLSGDGRRLASCTPEDHAVRIWDVATRQELHTLNINTGRLLSVDFSPDGMRLAIGTWKASNDSVTFASQVLVWDARPLTDALRAELNDAHRAEMLLADDLVESLAGEHPLTAELVEVLQADISLSESIRNKAVDRARNRSMNPQQLNIRSWTVAVQPGRSAAEYQLALRSAEAACELVPGNWMLLNTLGVAQYRAEKYAEAVETMSRCDQLHSSRTGESNPIDIAILAMAHFRVGHADEAHKLLEKTRQLMHSDRWKGNRESHQFLEEARQLIIRIPVNAQRPEMGNSARAGAGGGK